VIGTGVLAVVTGPALALGAAALWTLGPLAVLRARRGRDQAVLEAALPAVLEDIARGLRGGLALPVAVARTAQADHGPWQPHLGGIAGALDRGASLQDELRRLGRTEACPGLSLAVAALALASEAGGAQARAIDGVAGTLRDRAAVRAEQLALSSQARASALVMAVTPLAFAALAAVADPRTGRFLLTTGAGAACLVGGGLLDIAAAAWMIRISEGPNA
jgi:tight adherence protein B